MKDTSAFLAERYVVRTKPIGFYPLPNEPTTPAEFRARYAPFPSVRSRAGLVYVHVPFCTQRCGFCRFYQGSFDPDRLDAWRGAIAREARFWGELRRHDPCAGPVEAIFFGGGTPSVLRPADLEAVLDAIRRELPTVARPEITLEWYPRDARADLFAAAPALGVTRLSFGAQSFDAGTLAGLRAHHGGADVEAVVRMAKDAGFSTFNLDLMANVPGQTLASHLADVERAISLEPSMLSVNPLDLAAGTPLSLHAVEDPSAQRAWLVETRARLAAAGYRNQRARNFARGAALHRYNRRTDGIAFDIVPLGPGAYGFVGGWALSNEPDAAKWVAGSDDSGCAVYGAAAPSDTEMRRAFAVNSLLELNVDLVDYAAQFEAELEDDFPCVRALEERGVLVRAGGRLVLEGEAQLYADDVGYEFYSSSQAELFGRQLSVRRSSGGTQYFPVRVTRDPRSRAEPPSPPR
jgi:oxygen-independent coproporphyrinogen-3 oxidase